MAIKHQKDTCGHDAGSSTEWEGRSADLVACQTHFWSFLACLSQFFTHEYSQWPMNVNHWAKTVNMFMYNSQGTSETLFLPPLFLVPSADQIPDSATVADSRSHVGRINSPYKTCGRMVLHWLSVVIPACLHPKAVSVQHQTTAEKHLSANIIFLLWIIRTKMI